MVFTTVETCSMGYAVLYSSRSVGRFIFKVIFRMFIILRRLESFYKLLIYNFLYSAPCLNPVIQLVFQGLYRFLRGFCQIALALFVCLCILGQQ